VPLSGALRATIELDSPSAGKGSNKGGARPWILGGLSTLATAGLVIFHAALLAGRLADASIAHPGVITQWVGAVVLGGGALALRRRGSSLISGRGALVFWLLVLLLHVGFGSGITLTGEETGSTHELLLLVPLAGLAATGLCAARRDRRDLLRRKTRLPLQAFLAGPRLPLCHPVPATSSAGTGPARFSPRPPPFS
jgi:hypothetical protein